MALSVSWFPRLHLAALDLDDARPRAAHRLPRSDSTNSASGLNWAAAATIVHTTAQQLHPEPAAGLQTQRACSNHVPLTVIDNY